MNTPKLVIFDMDGIIFDSERLFMKFLQKNAAEYGYTVTEEQYIQTLGTGGDNLLRRLYSFYGPDYPNDIISPRTRQDLNAYAKIHGLPVKDGIPELLAFLKERSIPCCVASSTHTPYIRSYLKKTGLDGFFSLITGGDMVRNSKPHPEIFLTSCAHFGVAPQDALVLEDSENGLLAAHNGQIPAICIPDLKYPSAEYRDYACLIADSAFDVLTYFSED